VTRAQMAKFVENGRRNIDQAIGESLVLSTTFPNTPLIARTSYGFGEAVDAYCLSPGGCFAVRGHADQDGNWAGYFGSDGAGGVYAEQDDDNGSAVRGVSRGIDAEAGYFHAYGDNSYAGYFESDRHRGIYASGDPNFYGLYMNTAGSAYSAYFDGDITVTGNCLGCAPMTIVQNVGDSALEAGDLVTLVGSGPAVLGDSLVLLVRKATGPYDTAVAGIVGGAVYVPDAATRAAYLAQERARQAAQEAQQQALEQAMAAGTKTARPAIPMPEARITDREGNVHVDNSQTSIPPHGYARVLTSGTAQVLKVDAGRGAIQAGDLLVSSPTPGYAMKADDKLMKFGAIIGKALGNLDHGTGTLPVLVALK
jgi:hypothetical protein